MDKKLELELESILMQLETSAAAMISLNGAIQHIANESGIVIENVKLPEQDEINRLKLLQSVLDRVIKMGTLAAEIAAEEAPAKEPERPVLGMPPLSSQEITDEDAEEQEEEEVYTDPNLLAMFKSVRTKNVEDPYVDISGEVIRANFYNPDTPPESPEEFATYADQAVSYFKALTAKAQKAGLLDTTTTSQILVVLEGGDQFDEERIATKERELMQIVSEQGHKQQFFEVACTSPVETAEVIIAAYAISLARMRGAYIQVKLEELEDYMVNAEH